MKKLFLLCFALAGLLAFSVLVGCGLQKSSVNYTVTVNDIDPSIQSVSFEVQTVNNTLPTGYFIQAIGGNQNITLTASNFYSTNPVFVTPRILINHIHIDYAIVADSAGILGGFTPTAADNAANIVIPRGSSGNGISGEATGSGEAGVSTSIAFNNLISGYHINEIGNKIISVQVSGPSSGVYSYLLSYKTHMVERATVTLSGQDEYGNAVATSFTVDIQYI